MLICRCNNRLSFTNSSVAWLVTSVITRDISLICFLRFLRFDSITTIIQDLFTESLIF